MPAPRRDGVPLPGRADRASSAAARSSAAPTRSSACARATQRAVGGQRQFVAALRRAGDRQDAAGDRARARGARARRDRALRPLRRRVARPLPAVRHRGPALHGPPRQRSTLPPELEPELTRARALRPRAAPPPARAARAARRGRRDAPLPAVRGGHARCSPASPRERPTVLVLDDLQWADTSTALLLGHLLQRRRADAAARARHDPRGRRPPLPTSCTDLLGRLVPRPALRADRARAGSTRRRRGARARRATRDASDSFVLRLHEGTEGNPFFIKETLRSLAEVRRGRSRTRARPLPSRRASRS